MRAPTQATPAPFAFSIAVMAAKRMTRCPMPLSPSTRAVAGRSRTIRISGRGLIPPALRRRKIERQTDHAVGIAAAQISLDHQIGDNVRVFRPKAGSLEGALDERRQRRPRDARRLG